MSTIKVQNIQHTGSSTNTVALASDGTCTLASGSKLNNCTTDGTTNFTIADGNLNIGTSGHGVDFSVTSQASGQLGELFDDYEYGTWQPTANSTNLAITDVGCRYVKCGRLVLISFDFTNNSGSAATSIGGLPFGVVKHSTFNIGYLTNSAGSGQGSTTTTGGRIDFGGTLIFAVAGGTNNPTLVNGQRIIGSGSYVSSS